MFNLTRTEKFIIIFLSVSLLIAIAVKTYIASRPHGDIRIEKFDADSTRSPEKININAAGAEELESIKGVGKALAERIVEYRNSKGAFVMIEDIKNVKGIGRALFEKIKDRISVE
ncbi:MAG: ComEA family DNA-binding protein [Candidatus Omnitrophota bacterium]|jgi:comEA protein